MTEPETISCRYFGCINEGHSHHCACARSIVNVDRNRCDDCQKAWDEANPPVRAKVDTLPDVCDFGDSTTWPVFSCPDLTEGSFGRDPFTIPKVSSVLQGLSLPSLVPPHYVIIDFSKTSNGSVLDPTLLVPPSILQTPVDSVESQSTPAESPAEWLAILKTLVARLTGEYVYEETASWMAEDHIRPGDLVSIGLDGVARVVKLTEADIAV